jgi:hypothetical protein
MMFSKILPLTLLTTTALTFNVNAAQTKCSEAYQAKIDKTSKAMILNLGRNKGKGRSVGRAILNTVGATVGGAAAGTVAVPAAAAAGMALGGALWIAWPTLAGLTLSLAGEDAEVYIIGIGGGLALNAWWLTTTNYTYTWSALKIGNSVFNAIPGVLPASAAIGAGVGAVTGLVLGTHDSILAVQLKRLAEAKYFVESAKDDKATFMIYYDKLGKKLKKKYSPEQVRSLILKHEENYCKNKLMDFKDIKRALQKDALGWDNDIAELTEKNLKEEVMRDLEDEGGDPQKVIVVAEDFGTSNQLINDDSRFFKQKDLSIEHKTAPQNGVNLN